MNAYKVTHNNYQYCDNCRPKQHKPIIDMIDKTFGRLKVISRAENITQPNGQTKVAYNCECECGNKTIVTATHLISGHTSSCGCLHKEITHNINVKDLTGLRSGKIVVLCKDKIKNDRQHWKCKCDCGRIFIASSRSILNKKRKSCGCLISKAEYEFACFLEEKGYDYIAQKTFTDCKDKRTLPFDFAIIDKENNIIMLVELHGEQHYYPFTFNSEAKDIKIKNLEDRKRKDLIKEEYCKKHNIPLLIISYKQFYKKEKLFEKYYKQIKGE